MPLRLPVFGQPKPKPTVPTYKPSLVVLKVPSVTDRKLADNKITNNLVIVPPTMRRSSKQRTTIRHKANGQYFIDYFWEGLEPAFMKSPEELAAVRIVWCNTHHFSVSLTACHLYCATPCDSHIRNVQLYGWYDGGTPPHERSPQKVKPTAKEQREAKEEQRRKSRDED